MASNECESERPNGAASKTELLSANHGLPVAAKRPNPDRVFTTKMLWKKIDCLFSVA